MDPSCPFQGSDFGARVLGRRVGNFPFGVICSLSDPKGDPLAPLPLPSKGSYFKAFRPQGVPGGCPQGVPGGWPQAPPLQGWQWFQAPPQGQGNEFLV